MGFDRVLDHAILITTTHHQSFRPIQSGLILRHDFLYVLFIPKNIFIIMEAARQPKQIKCQNQFENVQSQTIIEVVSAREPHNTYAHAYRTLQNIDEDQEQTRLQLLEGNPILPPGKHLLREQPQFRLKFTSMRDKFNKTSFEKPGKSLKNIKAERSARMEEAKPKEDSNEDIEDIQYMSLLETRKLVYKRINNSKINCIGKDRILCSVFFDWRKERVIAKNQPIFQYLLRAKRLRCKQPQKDWITFNSSFQSGNLLLALKNLTAVLPTYQLYMQNDVNTKGCTQWYYFSAIPRGRGKVKLRIMNFYKPTSLYQKGMKILFSYDRVEWKRTGTSITYGRTSIDQNSYSLDFLHDFQVPEKETYFAYGYPYSYSEHLADYVNFLTSQIKFQRIMHKSVLCSSSMGNPIHILHISNFTNKKQTNRQLIYIIGRQHPGETPASYVVQGLINFLLSSCGEAKQLRDRYEFRVVPMVNVDGVISGNYRSNISGTDINRQWQFPSKKGHPEVFWLKQEIGNNKKQTAFFLDIHAHSRKMNSFFYGSKMLSKENRLFPFICSKMNKYISYGESAFTDDPSKKTTARVILQTEFSIPISLTYEVSFYGWTDPVKQTNISFKQGDLRQMGESLGIGLYYSLIGMQKAKQVKNNAFPKFQSEKEKVMVKNSMKLLEKWNKQLQKQVNEEDQAFSEGSSLNPQHFQLKEEEKLRISEMINARHENDGKNEFSRNLSTPKDQKKGSRRKILIYSTLETAQNGQESKLLAPKGESEQKNLGISSNQFYHFSSTARGTKKQPFSVRQLQLQLQIGGQVSPQRKLRGLRLKMGQNNQIFSGMDRYESLDMQRQKNYKNDVLQMKKALKYLLQSKSSDYDQYKSCFKSFNNDLIGLQKNQRYNK